MIISKLRETVNFVSIQTASYNDKYRGKDIESRGDFPADVRNRQKCT